MDNLSNFSPAVTFSRQPSRSAVVGVLCTPRRGAPPPLNPPCWVINRACLYEQYQKIIKILYVYRFAKILLHFPQCSLLPFAHLTTHFVAPIIYALKIPHNWGPGWEGWLSGCGWDVAQILCSCECQQQFQGVDYCCGGGTNLWKRNFGIPIYSF